jgi:ribosomal protein S18 acetylase RimI-like enzyme
LVFLAVVKPAVGLSGEIDALYVTPSVQGRGTSSTLARAAVVDLRARRVGATRDLVDGVPEVV